MHCIWRRVEFFIEGGIFCKVFDAGCKFSIPLTRLYWGTETTVRIFKVYLDLLGFSHHQSHYVLLRKIWLIIILWRNDDLLLLESRKRGVRVRLSWLGYDRLNSMKHPDSVFLGFILNQVQQINILCEVIVNLEPFFVDLRFVCIDRILKDIWHSKMLFSEKLRITRILLVNKFSLLGLSHLICDLTWINLIFVFFSGGCLIIG